MLEQIYSIKVNFQALINWVIVSFGLSIMHDFLDIIKSKATEEEQATIKPHVEEEWALEENVQ